MNTADFNVFEFNVSKFNSDLLSLLTSDSVTLSDDRTMSVTKPLVESQFIQDNTIQKQPAKGFTEEVRTAAWLTVKRKNPSQWSDD